MHNLPRISVITPSLNQGAYIERTIRSVLSQGYPDLEFIVVDGGSTDNTVSILRRYGNSLLWISEKDEGQSHAINKGMRMATGDIIAYLNSDDIYEPGALTKVAAAFAEDASVMWLTGRCRIVDQNGCETRRAITAYKNFLLGHFSYAMLLVTNPISQPATFWRRAVVDEIGFFNVDEHLVMDYEYWLRIGGKYPLQILGDYLACFRVHASAKTQSTGFGNFRREYEVSRRFTSSPLLHTLHYFNYLAIVAAYKTMGLASRPGRRVSSDS